MKRLVALDALVGVVVVVMLVTVVGVLARAAALPNTRFIGEEVNALYFRLSAIDLRYEALALGALGYALRRPLALRIGAVLGLLGFLAEAAAWVLEPAASVRRGGLGTSAVTHVAHLVAYAGVVVWWFVAVRDRPRLGEVESADFA